MKTKSFLTKAFDLITDAAVAATLGCAGLCISATLLSLTPKIPEQTRYYQRWAEGTAIVTIVGIGVAAIAATSSVISELKAQPAENLEPREYRYEILDEVLDRFGLVIVNTVTGERQLLTLEEKEKLAARFKCQKSELNDKFFYSYEATVGNALDDALGVLFEYMVVRLEDGSYCLTDEYNDVVPLTRRQTELLPRHFSYRFMESVIARSIYSLKSTATEALTEVIASVRATLPDESACNITQDTAKRVMSCNSCASYYGRTHYRETGEAQYTCCAIHPFGSPESVCPDWTANQLRVTYRVISIRGTSPQGNLYAMGASRTP